MEVDSFIFWFAIGKHLSVEGTIEWSKNLVDKLRAMEDGARSKSTNTIE